MSPEQIREIRDRANQLLEAWLDEWEITQTAPVLKQIQIRAVLQAAETLAPPAAVDKPVRKASANVGFRSGGQKWAEAVKRAGDWLEAHPSESIGLNELSRIGLGRRPSGKERPALLPALVAQFGERIKTLQTGNRVFLWLEPLPTPEGPAGPPIEPAPVQDLDEEQFYDELAAKYGRLGYLKREVLDWANEDREFRKKVINEVLGEIARASWLSKSDQVFVRGYLKKLIGLGEAGRKSVSIAASPGRALEAGI